MRWPAFSSPPYALDFDLLGCHMLAPGPACDFVNENAPHPGAPNQGARKQGLQAKQGLNGAPI